MDAVIRPATIKDISAIRECFRVGTGRVIQPRIAELIDTYPSLVANHPDGSILGFVYCDRLAPDILTIANIFVCEHARRQSLGSCLLEGLEVEASAVGWRALVLINSVLYPNKLPGSLVSGFYQRMGYQRALDTGESVVWTKLLGA
jgi:N-acetylglutamate synthase-like GNAT family acetyltransferase